MSETPSTWDPTPKAEPEPRGMLAEFWSFFWENWLWWATPTVLILGGLAALVFFSQDESVAPFIYALF